MTTTTSERASRSLLVTLSDGCWVVEAAGANGERQRFLCATEEMAQRLARALERGSGERLPVMRTR